MKVRQFKEVLAATAKLYEHADVKDRQQALQKFSKLFDGHEDKTVTAFVNLLEKKTDAKTSKK